MYLFTIYDDVMIFWNSIIKTNLVKQEQNSGMCEEHNIYAQNLYIELNLCFEWILYHPPNDITQEINL